MANPIPSSEEFDLDWLATEMHEWKGIQEMINESQQREDDRVIHHTWISDIPFLHLYHTLVDDSIRAAFGKAYAAKTREELDGRNSLLFPLSIQKLCSLHKHSTRAFMWWIGRCELSGDFRIPHRFVSTPKAHSMLIRA